VRLKPRAYPIDQPASDPRFTFGLALDVATVLAEHGYPELTSGLDIVALEQALFAFLYRPVSAHLGSQPAEPIGQAAVDAAKFSDDPLTRAAAQAYEDGDDYGHDRVDNGDASAEVPNGVEGGPVTGRATVPTNGGGE
jgi:hypothetical protein